MGGMDAPVGHDRRWTAANAMALLIRSAPHLAALQIEGFCAYWKRYPSAVTHLWQCWSALLTRPVGRSRIYRQWSAEVPLFSELPAYPETAPPLSSLSCRSCCLTDGDVKRITACFPNLRTVEMHCCAGFEQITVETHLMPYVDLDFENDDYWHPDDTNEKARDVHY